MEGLYPIIRTKLAAALKSWHPKDESALLLIAPWKTVFDEASMEAFLLRSIIPKLQECLHYFVVDPRQQDLRGFDFVIRWEPIVPAHHLVAIMETEFFPKWHQVLFTWLSSYPNYEEISHWYRGWKQVRMNIKR